MDELLSWEPLNLIINYLERTREITCAQKIKKIAPFGPLGASHIHAEDLQN